MKGSMTEGRPLPLILRFALPLLLGNLLQQTYNIIDAAIVGRVLGSGALAAVGATSSVQFLVLGFCLGVCTGFGVPVAKYFGAQDLAHMKKCVFHGIVICTVLAAVMTTVTAVLCTQILHILSIPQDIYRDTYRYLFVIFLGIPFMILYNYLSGILRAVGDSRAPFLFLAVSTVLNIGLDLFCITVLHWGCTGAAIATVSAQAISGLLCLIYIIRRVPQLHLTRGNLELDGRCAQELLLIGLPMGMQYSITAIGSMVMQSANNGLGSIYVSGFTAGAKIKNFLMCPFDAVATAVSVFASQNLGAGKPERIRTGVLHGLLLVILYGAGAGVVMIFGGRQMSMLFLDGSQEEILDAAAQYVRALGFFFGILGVLNLSRMTVQGLGYAGRSVISGALEMLARVLVSFLLVGRYGYTAICYADQTAWIFAVLYITPMCFWCVKKTFTKYGRTTYNETSEANQI